MIRNIEGMLNVVLSLRYRVSVRIMSARPRVKMNRWIRVYRMRRHVFVVWWPCMCVVLERY